MAGKVGLFLTKARPFHKGHELIVQTMTGICDQSCVVISDTKEEFQFLSPDKRYRLVDRKESANHWVSSYYDDLAPNPELNEKGVATNEAFWEFWLDRVRAVEEEYGFFFTHVFGGEAYCRELAARLGIVAVIIDETRSCYPTSGTAIRADLLGQWEFLTETGKKLFQKTVVVVGPESSGKTTLCNQLNAYFNQNSILVPEFGRLLSAQKNNRLNREDFKKILVTQKSMINASRQLTPTFAIVFSDTDYYATYKFAPVYGVELAPDYENFTVRPDLVLLCPPDLPFVQDGTRLTEDLKLREVWVEDLLLHYKKTKQRVELVDHKDFNSTVQKVKNLFIWGAK